MNDELRIEIVGVGPVALACALFLARQGLPAGSIAVDARPTPVPPALGERALAMGVGSWQLLNRICTPPPAAPILDVEVSLRGRAGRTRISARDMQVEALGQVVRYRDLVAQLRAACATQPFAAPGTTAPGTTVQVHAEGDTGEAARVREFDQSALLADVRTGLPDRGIAYERFTADGPLALLPLPTPGTGTIVWCGSHAQTEARAALEPHAFATTLQAALGLPGAQITLVSERRVAPLTRRLRTAVVDGHSVWIGNAAQALHPVAGQGLNLGLRDAFELARCLARCAPGSAGIEAALRDYRRARANDRRTLVGITDTLARAFTVAPLRPLQSVALAALDLAGPLRGALAQRLMYGVR